MDMVKGRCKGGTAGYLWLSPTPPSTWPNRASSPASPAHSRRTAKTPAQPLFGDLLDQTS